jgi:prepilin-type N-terminal cleavage/methylation domain-containing protein
MFVRQSIPHSMLFVWEATDEKGAMAVMLISAARLSMQRIDSRSAFTLLELIAVLVLLGLISTIATIVVTGHLEKAELGRITQLLAASDRKERDASRQSFVPGGLYYDRSKQRFYFKNSARTIEMGNSVKIAELVVIGPTTESGSILFTQNGQSQTYAIRLQSRRGAAIWLLVAGLTGQVRLSENTDEIRSVLRMGGS